MTASTGSAIATASRSGRTAISPAELYGVNLGRAFFGESMFHRVRDASKVALVHLVARLIAGGFELLDTQYVTEHLKTLWRGRNPAAALHRAARQGDHGRARAFTRLPADRPISGAEALEIIAERQRTFRV